MYTVYNLCAKQRRNGIGICSGACRSYDVRPRTKNYKKARRECLASTIWRHHFSSAPVRDIMLRFIISSLLLPPSVENRVSVFSFALSDHKASHICISLSLSLAVSRLSVTTTTTTAAAYHALFLTHRFSSSGSGTLQH